MKIQKIEKISGYKCFRNYSWAKFQNAELFHQKMNIVFGENGSGKSSICNIFKAVSNEKDFYRYFPQDVKLKINNKTYSYSNSSWNQNIDRGDFLFFDREFVDDNIHLGRSRGTQQGEQEQKSARLIIEFDAEAIKLRKKRDELSEAKNSSKSQLDQFQENYQSILSFNLSDEEQKLFKRFNSLGKKRLVLKRKALNKKKLELEQKLSIDSEILEKTKEIQSISDLDPMPAHIPFSSKLIYQAVFNFKLTEKLKINADKVLISKIASHKDFFEKGFSIREEHVKKCPFCQSTNRESEIKRILQVYKQIYDETYDEQKRLFEQKKQQLINELENIKTTYQEANITDLFLKLKRLSEQYSIKKIYSVDEEEKFNKRLSLKKIDALINKISELEKPNNEDIADFYNNAKKEILNIRKLLTELNRLVVKKNRIISTFKQEHTDTKIKTRVEQYKNQLNQIVIELDFINSSKIINERDKRKISKKLEVIQKRYDQARENHKLSREAYQDYCSSDAFSKTLKKIESYFEYFNFDFKLSLDTHSRHTASMADVPFAFKVLDLDGNERDLKEGLSEGEVQVLSICFFLAFLDIQGDRSKKVLVFDDPITSLDDSNLSNLVDLIAKVSSNYSQIFIFTHHRTFFKFLRKKYGKNCNEYLILRNHKLFGGSFVCKSKEERFIEKLRSFESHLSNIARNPNGFDIELKIVEYGQFLRYETEHFIKYRLLNWDKSKFADAVDGIKNNKKIDDDDLERIKEIYSFCNWTTSHVDVGDDHGLTQLKDKSKLFVEIYDKYKNLN